MVLDWTDLSFSLPGVPFRNHLSMTLEGDTAVVQSTLMWRVGIQSLVHFVGALSRGSWMSTEDRHSDS
jgi:hypothetical protein